MFNINRMVLNNDYSALLNSTQQERDESGGNLHIYDELSYYLYLDEVREVIEQIFKDDEEILEHLNTLQ
jgi:hypothetical protein